MPKNIKYIILLVLNVLLANNFCVKLNFAIESEKPLGIFYLLYSSNKIFLAPVIKCIKYCLLRLEARYKKIHPLVLKFNKKYSTGRNVERYLNKYKLKKCFGNNGKKIEGEVLPNFRTDQLCGITGLLFFKYLKKIDIKVLANKNNIDWESCNAIQHYFLNIDKGDLEKTKKYLAILKKENLLKENDINIVNGPENNLAKAIKHICTKMKNNYYTLINFNNHIVYLIAFDGIVTFLDNDLGDIIQTRQTTKEEELTASFVKTVDKRYKHFHVKYSIQCNFEEIPMNIEFLPVLPFGKDYYELMAPHLTTQFNQKFADSLAFASALNMKLNTGKFKEDNVCGVAGVCFIKALLNCHDKDNLDNAMQSLDLKRNFNDLSDLHINEKKEEVFDMETAQKMQLNVNRKKNNTFVKKLDYVIKNIGLNTYLPIKCNNHYFFVINYHGRIFYVDTSFKNGDIANYISHSATKNLSEDQLRHIGDYYKHPLFPTIQLNFTIQYSFKLK